MTENPNRRAGAGRERVITTARRLFVERGAGNVGINEVIAEAGIARMTLYNHFASKDEMIAAVYEEMAQEELSELQRSVHPDAPETERILSVFDHCGRNSARVDYRGCPFIHASLQASDATGAVHAIVRRYKSALRAFVFSVLNEGRQERGQLADQIVLLLDGAVTESYLKGVDSPVEMAKRAAVTLIRASG